MTLRDFGAWIGRVWDRIISDLEIVVTSSPLDWPIWVFFAGLFLIFIVIPMAIGKILYEARVYLRDEPPMGLGWCIGFTVGTALCALVVMDLYVFQSIYEDPESEPLFLYIGYPIMTTVFGLAAVVEWRKQLKVWRDRRDH